LAGSFFGAGAPSLMSGERGQALPAYLIGGILFALAISWHWIKRLFGPALAASANKVASDFRWWLAVFFVLFLYVIAPLPHSLSLKESGNGDVSDSWARMLLPAQQKKIADECGADLLRLTPIYPKIQIKSAHSDEAVGFAEALDAALNNIPLMDQLAKKYNIVIANNSDTDNSVIGVWIRSTTPDTATVYSGGLVKCLRDSGIKIHVDPHPIQGIDPMAPLYILVGLNDGSFWQR
jgi:hypothetical protein